MRSVDPSAAGRSTRYLPVSAWCARVGSPTREAHPSPPTHRLGRGEGLQPAAEDGLQADGRCATGDVPQLVRISAEVVELSPAVQVLDVEPSRRPERAEGRRPAVVVLARPEVLHLEVPTPAADDPAL